MNNYESLKSLSLTSKRKLANNTYLVIRDDGGLAVKLHDTEVVIHYPTKIVLDSGGWQTVTTKARINEFSRVNLTQSKGVWYVNGVPYADGMTVYNSGHITGKGALPKKTESLRKKVNAYAKKYADLFVAGKIPAPSGGDCWCCLMPIGGKDHIKSHIKEDYFVPSMLNHCTDTGHLSSFTKGFIGETWQTGTPPAFMTDVAHSQIKRGIQQHCLHELGLVA